jgi:hypothetical protein
MLRQPTHSECCRTRRYGYNNIKRVDPSVATYGIQQPVNQLSDSLRVVVAEAGYSEALTFALVSPLPVHLFPLALAYSDAMCCRLGSVRTPCVIAMIEWA